MEKKEEEGEEACTVLWVRPIQTTLRKRVTPLRKTACAIKHTAREQAWIHTQPRVGASSGDPRLIHHAQSRGGGGERWWRCHSVCGFYLGLSRCSWGEGAYIHLDKRHRTKLRLRAGGVAGGGRAVMVERKAQEVQ